MVIITEPDADGNGHSAKNATFPKRIGTTSRLALFPPVGLSPEKVLKPSELLDNANNLQYALHTIVRLMDGDGVATFNREWMVDVTGKKFNKIFQRMEREGCVILVEEPIWGERSSGYTLPKEVLDKGTTLTFPTHPLFIERLSQYHRKLEEYRRSEWTPTHHGLDDSLHEFTVNLPSAMKVLDKWKKTREKSDRKASNGPYVAQHGRLLRLSSHRAGIVSIDKQGRIHSTLTALLKILRPHVRLRRKPVVSVDLSACQPTLLINTIFWLLQQHPWIVQNFNDPQGPDWWHSRQYTWGFCKTSRLRRQERQTQTRHHPHINILPPYPPISGGFRGGTLGSVAAANGSDGGVFHWTRLCIDQVLYEYFMDRTGLSRKQVKTGLFSGFISKRPFKKGDPKARQDYPNPVEQVVKRDFPAIYYAVRWLSRDDYAATIRHLQQREADVILRACGNVQDGVPVATIFDCLVGRVQDQKLLEDALDMAGREMGIPVKYKDKRW